MLDSLFALYADCLCFLCLRNGVASGNQGGRLLLILLLAGHLCFGWGFNPAPFPIVFTVFQLLVTEILNIDYVVEFTDSAYITT